MAQGKFGGGNGSSTNPYLIEDASDLNAMRNYLSSCFKLVNDINFGTTKYINGQGWNPIKNFKGVFDGGNCKLINFYINRPTEDFVGFFKSCYGQVKNITFVDPQVTGHNYVGVVFGYSMNDTYGALGSSGVGDEYRNIIILNAQVNGNVSVCGLGGALVNYVNSSNINKVFIDANLVSQDGVVYGLSHMINSLAVRGRWTSYVAQDWTLYLGEFYTNCNCECNCGRNCPNYDCNCFGLTTAPIIKNCCVKLHKNANVTTYYAFCDMQTNCSACYVDNSEFAPIVGSGAEYKNLTNIDYSTNILPNIDNTSFKKEWEHKLEPLNLNKDSIYFKTKDGYVTYNFTTKEWEVEYVKFTNENSLRIIQNGMSRTDLPKIPVAKLKELQEENSKIKIVNCINAHEKIVSKTETVEINKFKEYLDKNIFRNKIKFDKYNDKIMNVIRI